jgi:hypothetical protein
MARKPRIEFEGGLCHVITRGNQKQKIFLQKRDFLKYLECLRRCEKTQKLTDWTGGCRRNCRAVTFFSLNDKDVKQCKVANLKRLITITFSKPAFYSFGDISLVSLLSPIFSHLLGDDKNRYPFFHLKNHSEPK